MYLSIMLPVYLAHKNEIELRLYPYLTVPVLIQDFVAGILTTLPVIPFG